MFAILLSSKMDPFYYNVASFPTLIFSVLFILMIFYWVLAVLGLVEIDALDFEIPDGDVSAGLDGSDDLSNLNVMSGLLLKLGLNGVPTTIILSVVALIGWMVCFTAVHYIFPWVPTRTLEFLIGIPVFIGSLVIAVLAAKVILGPFQPMFLAANQIEDKKILGKVAIVRTSRVDKTFGEASVADGGAGLIVKVRAYKDESFKHGDRVVLLEHDIDNNIYKVISENEFTH